MYCFLFLTSTLQCWGSCLLPGSLHPPKTTGQQLCQAAVDLKPPTAGTQPSVAAGLIHMAPKATWALRERTCPTDPLQDRRQGTNRTFNCSRLCTKENFIPGFWGTAKVSECVATHPMPEQCLCRGVGGGTGAPNRWSIPCAPEPWSELHEGHV